jgi:hypothetical protein
MSRSLQAFPTPQTGLGSVRNNPGRGRGARKIPAGKMSKIQPDLWKGYVTDRVDKFIKQWCPRFLNA